MATMPKNWPMQNMTYGTSVKAIFSYNGLFIVDGGSLTLELINGMIKMARIMNAMMRTAQGKPTRGSNCWKTIG